jgi:hypothetical protein
MQKAKKRIPPRTCIFCGKGSLTHEHVWADWLKRYIPKDMPEYTSLSAIVHPTHSELKRKKHSGDIQSRRLRVVCQSCNNGWMSQLQERAKPYLLPLIAGEVTAFNVTGQKVLAAWITMFVMVAEHFDGYKVATTMKQRRYFYLYREPPAFWKIWIGDYERGSWVGRLAHFALPLASKGRRVETMDNGMPRPNTQTMTFTVGRLFVHVRSSVTDIFENWHFARRDLLAQIRPIERNIIGWPKTTMADRDADGISADFQRRSDEVGRRMVEESWSGSDKS